MIECACATGTFCSTVVQVPWLPEVTEVHVTPKGVPLGVPKGVPLDARMCNRNVRNIRPSETGSDVIKRHPKGIPLEGSAHAQTEVAEYPIKRHP